MLKIKLYNKNLEQVDSVSIPNLNPPPRLIKYVDKLYYLENGKYVEIGYFEVKVRQWN